MTVAGTHDPIIVALSVLIAVCASFTALDLAARGRIAVVPARTGWLGTAALAMGGGIWAMHFVAMLAFSMPGMEIDYGLGLTGLSLLLAVGATGFGFYTVGFATRPSPLALLASGFIMGLGIAGMHFTGMAAMRMQAEIRYDWVWEVGAVVVAIAAATAALWLSLRTTRLLERMAAAVVMGCAVSGMHYTSMYGASFSMRPGMDIARGSAEIGQVKLAIAVATATFLVLFMALVASLFDRRYAATERSLRDDLRAAYDRQSLMLRLVGRMRVIDDPVVIMREVAEAIGQHLAIDRVGFFRVHQNKIMDMDAGACWSAGRLPIVVGKKNAAAYIDRLDARVRGGEALVVSDTSLDKAHSAFLDIGTRAVIAVPLMRKGHWVGSLYCHHAAVRTWAPPDVRLVEDVAEQSWDAVERAEARQQLRLLNDELVSRVEEQTRETRLIADALPVLIAFVDRDLTYRFANRAYQDWLYVSPEFVVGRNLAELLGADQFGLRSAYIERALAGEPVTFELEWPHLDRTPRIAEIRYLPRFDKDGAVDGLHIFVVDITDRVTSRELLRTMNAQLEAQVAERTRELQHAEEQLRQSQKMEAVGQLTGGLAHDFNNLLTGVLGGLELLQLRVTQGRYADVDRYVAAAQGAANRAATLTHRLLAFSRRQTLDPKVVDVARLVTDMLDLVRGTVGPSIDVDAVSVAGAWPARVDPNQLENALLNLCINARDAMPDGGRITIEVTNTWLDERDSREKDLPAGQYLSLCVKDNGTGMAPDVMRRAFDPFFTTKPTGEGTGLGLSMIYGFARQSGGQVHIQSELGEGTAVCVYLPRHHGPPETDRIYSSSSQPQAEQGQTVLVVDDEPTVRMLVVEVLEELGYHTIDAENGASGLEILESNVRIDLLVSDVGLPGGMNGRQMADRARIVRPDLKILFITGYAETAVVGNGNLEPGMHIMTKPFTMDALMGKIECMMIATTPFAERQYDAVAIESIAEPRFVVGATGIEPVTPPV